MEIIRCCSFVWVYLLLLCSALAKAATPSVDLCPRYVEEGGNLTCKCTSGDCSSSDVTVSWLKTGHATDTLVLTKVRRQNNGTKFTCQMTCGGVTSTTDYTLRVGYGPTQEHMTIEGQAAFITNGTKTLTLTCKATDVYPRPLYNWLDALCQPNSNGNTCSFKPKPPDHDGKAVRCRASDTFRDETQSAVTDYTLSLKYPPPKAPVIWGHTPGQLVKDGDILTCTVTGGKPPVASVNFHCENPTHRDQKDSRNGTSVSSPLTIDTSQATIEDMACTCSATWTLEPDSYSLTRRDKFQVSYPAYIASFTVNGTSGSLMVSEGDSQITLTCHVMSIYEPQITLAKRRGEDVEILSGDEMTVNVAGRIMTFTLINVTCDDMAVYTCFADDDKVDVHLRVLDCPVSTTSELLQVPFGAIAGAIFPCIVFAITIGCLYLWDKKKKGAGLYEKTTTSSAQDQDSSLYADLRPGDTSTSPQSASVTSDKEIRPELPTRDDPADRDDAACKRNTYQTLGEATDEIYTGLQAPGVDPDYLCPVSPSHPNQEA